MIPEELEDDDDEVDAAPEDQDPSTFELYKYVLWFYL